MNAEKEVIDIEIYAKEGKKVPKDHTYKIKIDKIQYTVSQAIVTGRELLILTGKIPEQFILRQKINGQVVRIELNQEVDLTASGVERFMTIPNEVTEGEATVMRSDFELMKDDSTYLRSLDLNYEAVFDGQVRKVIIHGFPIPEGYNVDKASVYVCLQSGYPDAQIDMAYFYPGLSRADGKAIGALSPLEFDGKSWQQWSRHRTAASVWRMGEDNLSTHMTLVADWLNQELLK